MASAESPEGEWRYGRFHCRVRTEIIAESCHPDGSWHPLPTHLQTELIERIADGSAVRVD